MQCSYRVFLDKGLITSDQQWDYIRGHFEIRIDSERNPIYLLLIFNKHEIRIVDDTSKEERLFDFHPVMTSSNRENIMEFIECVSEFVQYLKSK